MVTYQSSTIPRFRTPSPLALQDPSRSMLLRLLAAAKVGGLKVGKLCKMVMFAPGARVRPSTNHWVSYQPTIGNLTNQLLGIKRRLLAVMFYQPGVMCTLVIFWWDMWSFHERVCLSSRCWFQTCFCLSCFKSGFHHKLRIYGSW